LASIFSSVMRCSCAVLVVASLAACANDFSSAPRPRKNLVVDGLDVDMTNTVFIKGFSIINDRSFIEPDMGKLVVAGLDNFKTIDPALGAKVENHRVFLTYNDVQILNLGPADKKDIPQWSLTSIRALLAARRVSKPLKEANTEAMYKAMFSGALTLVDPYSRYASYKDAIKYRLMRDGVIGLGVRLERSDDAPVVAAIVDAGPGWEAGLRIHDKIVSVNGESLADMPLVDARKRLDGTLGQIINLVVKRPGTREHLNMTAALDLVIPDTVTSEITDGVLTMRIKSFTQRTAQNVRETVLPVRDQIKGIVLDLRGDPGGLLDQAVNIADLFLETGTIATLHGRHPGANQYYSADREDISGGLPIAVLVDGKSASAAEIVAAALQDNGRAAVVGTVSWGKGSVQTLQRLPNGGEIAITWARVQVPRGVALHGLGLMPDLCLSGAPVSADAVLAQLGSDTLSTVRRRWRDAPDASDVHEALRQECPAEQRADNALDLEVARRVVADRTLYAQATFVVEPPQVALIP
jgi:carboxyl-terminal processing protease